MYFHNGENVLYWIPIYLKYAVIILLCLATTLLECLVSPSGNYAKGVNKCYLAKNPDILLDTLIFPDRQ